MLTVIMMMTKERQKIFTTDIVCTAVRNTQNQYNSLWYGISPYAIIIASVLP